MTLKAQPGSGVNGPLWLIAFSLLTIAICLVFLVIEKQVAEPKNISHADSSIKTPPSSPRQERLRLSPGSSPRRADAFGNLASAQTSGAGNPSLEVASEPRPGFLPTTMEPLPGSYLPALPRIVGQPDFRTVVKGRVMLKGIPPAEQETPVPDDYPCPAPEPPVLKTRYFIVGTNGGLANTVVYLAGDPNRFFQMSNVTNELVFTDCRLEPAFSVVIRGQPLRARDNLGVAHVLQGITGDDGEGIEVAPGGTVSLPTRPKSELPITIICKTHPWEKSQVGFAFPGIPSRSPTGTASSA